MSSGRTPSRREFLAAVAVIPLAPSARLTSASARPEMQASYGKTPARFMYVGSFTGEGRGRGDGLSVYERTGGRWTRIQLIDKTKIADPSFLCIDRRGRFLYSAHGGGTIATSYAIDEASGRLTVLNQQPTKGENGVHVAIDATGRFLALPNYASGSLVIFPINADGTLGAVSDLAQ